MPTYRFNGDVVFSPTLDDNGELHFTVPTKELKVHGIPLGKDVCVHVGFKAATIEAANRNTAYDVLREYVHELRTDGLPHLKTCNERSWDWSREDVLFTQELQLQQFTPEEIADPDTILTTLSNQYAPAQPPQDAIRAARRRWRKLRRVQGLRAFVEAHPNLDIKCRDEMTPASRLIINCPGNHDAVPRHGDITSITCITSVDPVQIHVKDLHTGLEAYIAPTDVHAFDVFMQGVELATQANLVHGVIIHEPPPPPPHVLTAEEVALAEQRQAWSQERDAWSLAHPYPQLPGDHNVPF